MTTPSPLIPTLRDAEATFLPYADAAQLVETFGSLELEYAAIRKSAGLIDLPQHGTIRATGGDRLEFLNRMLTQQLEPLEAWSSARSFLTNRQGRIVADLTVVHTPEETLLDVDVLALRPTLELLDQFLFGEDVAFEDASGELHRLGLHGPTAPSLLAALAMESEGGSLDELPEGRCVRTRIAGHPVICHRWDAAGVPGLMLTVPADAAEAVHTAIAALGIAPEHDHVEAKTRGEAHPYRLRLVGWHALNIARIEAGTPLFNVDFGQGNLPAETGVLEDRVSFSKGCYPGQEVVARMRNLGHPKQTLAGLRMEGSAGGDGERQPQTGAAVHEAGAGADAKPVGAITSSAVSPVLSNAVLCFGQVKWSASKAGTAVEVETRAGRVAGAVQPALRFLPAPE